MKNGILILVLMFSFFATESEARRCRGGGCGGGWRFPILRMICGGRGQPSCGGGGRVCGPQGCGSQGRVCGPQGCGPQGRVCGPQGCGPQGRVCGPQGCGPQGRVCGPQGCGNGGHNGGTIDNTGQGRVVDPVVVDPSFVATNERPPADVTKDTLLPLLQDAGVPATAAEAISKDSTGEERKAVANQAVTITSSDQYYAELAKDKAYKNIVVAFTADDCGPCQQFKETLKARFNGRSDVKIYFINRPKISEPAGNSLVTLYQSKGYLNGVNAVPSGFVAFQQGGEWKINGDRVMEQFNFTNQLENELVRQVGR